MDPLPEPTNVICPECGGEHFTPLDDRRLVIRCDNEECAQRYRQLAIMLVAPSLIANMAQGIFRVVHDAVEDAQLVSSSYDWQRDCFAMLIWSSTFDLVREGDAAPIMPCPRIERLEIIPSVEPGVVFGVIPDDETGGDDTGEPMLQMTIGVKTSVFDEAANYETRGGGEDAIRRAINELSESLAPSLLDAYIVTSDCPVGWK